VTNENRDTVTLLWSSKGHNLKKQIFKQDRNTIDIYFHEDEMRI